MVRICKRGPLATSPTERYDEKHAAQRLDAARLSSPSLHERRLTLKFFIATYGEVPVPDLLTIGGIMLLVALIGGGLWLLFGNVVLAVMLALVIGLLIILQATVASTHQQEQALTSLTNILHLNAPLPAFRSWNAAPDLAAILCETILVHKPKLMVEVGGGLSSIIAGYTMERLGEGRDVAFDHLAEFVGKTAGNIRKHQLEDRVSVRHAPLTPVEINGREWMWYDTAQFEDLHDIDLLFIDGPPNSTQILARYPALPLLFDRLSEDAIIILDDANRVMERRAVKMWLEEFPTLTAERLLTKRGGVILRRGEAVSPPLDEAG